MENPRVLIQVRDPRTANQLERAIRSYGAVPFEVDLERRDSRDYRLCFLQLDDVRRFFNLATSIRDNNPNARFVFYDEGTKNGKMEASLEDLTGMAQFHIEDKIIRKHLDLKIEEQQIHRFLERMRGEGKFTGKLTIGLLGSSNTNLTLLQLLHETEDDKIIDKIHLYSPTAVQNEEDEKSSAPNGTSYRGIIASKDLLDWVVKEKLKTHYNLRSFCSETAHADEIIFATGPLKRKEGYSVNFRGPGSEEFYKDLFNPTAPRAAELAEIYRRMGATAHINNFSNPNGSLDLILGEIYGHDKVYSVTPDHLRANKILLRLAKAGNLPRMFLPYLKIEGVKIYGEHHKPEVRANEVRVKAIKNGDIPYLDLKLSDVLRELNNERDIEDFNGYLTNELLKLARDSAIGGTQAVTDRITPAKAIVNNLRAMAKYRESSESCARYDPALGAYLIGNTQELRGTDSFQTILDYASEQIQLAQSYLPQRFKRGA